MFITLTALLHNIHNINSAVTQCLELLSAQCVLIRYTMLHNVHNINSTVTQRYTMFITLTALLHNV